MSLSDPIADMLCRIRNASRAKYDWIILPSSKMKEAVLNVLKEEGFIRDYKRVEEGKKKDLKVHLSYYNKEPAIRHLKKVSTPGRRSYIQVSNLRPLRNNMGTYLLSTSKGIMTGRRAKKMNLGGEIICQVW